MKARAQWNRVGKFASLIIFSLIAGWCSGPLTAAPDLIVQNTTCSPASSSAGNAVQFTSTIKNQGTTATPSGTIHSIAFYIDGTLVNWSNNLSPYLVPGAISIQSANGGTNGTSKWTSTAGSHSLRAYVDDANRIAESNESNNNLTVTLNVAGTSPAPAPTPTPTTANGPDLIVSNLSWSPDPVDAGDPVLFTATIKNQGNQSTPSGTIHGVAFSVDGTLVSWSNNLAPVLVPGAVSIQSANGGTNGTSKWAATGGTHAIDAFVDDANRITEINENNNRLSATMSVSGGTTPPPPGGTSQPDLIVTDISWSPAAPTEGNAVQFSATVKNQGTASTPSGTVVSVAFSVDGTIVNSSNNNSTALAAGASRVQSANTGSTGTSTWASTEGTHTVTAWVDHGNTIAESNESNNQLNESLSVAGSTTTTDTPPPYQPPFGTSAYISNVNNALASNADTWGQAVIGRPEGPTYENIKGYLEPLARVNAGFKYYPLVLSMKEGQQKTRLAGHGNQIDIGLWWNGRPLENGVWMVPDYAVQFFAGSGQEEFGLNDAKRVGPLPHLGYIPVYTTHYTAADGKTYVQKVAAYGTPLMTYVSISIPAGGTIALSIQSQLGVLHVSGKQVLNASNKVVCAASGGTLSMASGKAWIRVSAAPAATTLYLALPYVATAGVTAPTAVTFDQAVQNVTNYWNGILAQGSSIQVPETVVMNAWKSLLISNFSIVRDHGMLYSFGNYYETFYTYEATRAILAFALYGHMTAAQNYFYQANRTPSGEFHLASLVRTGCELQKLGAAPSYISGEYATLKTHTDKLNNGRKSTSTGLQPKGVYAGDVGGSVWAMDHNLGAYGAIRDFSHLSKALGYTANGNLYWTDSQNYRQTILNAINASLVKTTNPWFVPQSLYAAEAPFAKITATRMGSYYNLVASRIQDTGLFGPQDPLMNYLNGYLENYGGRLLGLLRYHPNSSLYTQAGVDDLYQGEYNKSLLWRNEVDKFLVTFYGKLAHGMTPDTFVGAEVLQVAPVTGERGRRMYLPPNSSANAHFLHNLRNMLVLEEDANVDGVSDALYILKGTPRAWLAAGKTVSFTSMRTHFGLVSASAQVSADGRQINSTVNLPAGAVGKTVKLRLRRPAGFALTSATINGVAAGSRMNASSGEIDLTGYTGAITVVTRY